MVGRGDDDAVDVLSGDDFPIVEIGFSIADGGDFVSSAFEAIGDGDALGESDLSGHTEQMSALITDSDMSDRNPFARGFLTENGGRDDERGRNGQCRRFEKVSPCLRVSGHNRLLRKMNE